MSKNGYLRGMYYERHGQPLWTRLSVGHEAAEVFGLVERGRLTVAEGRALVAISAKEAAEIRKLFDRHEAREAIGTRRAILAEFDRPVAAKGRAKRR
jgi:hypothetical protein